MLSKTQERSRQICTTGAICFHQDKPLCIIGGGVALRHAGNHNSHAGSPNSNAAMKQPSRVGNKSYHHPPCTPRPYQTALPKLGDNLKKNGIRGFAVFGMHKALHNGSHLSAGDHGERADGERFRHSARGKLETGRSEDYYAFDSLPIEEFRQGGFSLMVRGGNSSSSFPTSRSVRSVCSSEDLIVTSIKLSRDGEDESVMKIDRKRTLSKHDGCSSDSEQSFLEEISPGRFLINGKEVRMPDVPPPSMRSYYKPYTTQSHSKATPRSNFERLRRPQRTSPRPRTFCANRDEEATDPPQFVPIQLTKTNKVTVAFENYLNTNAKPKSAKLHRRPDARLGSPTKNRDSEIDDKLELAATPKVHFDVKSIIKKYTPGGQQTLAGRIVDSTDLTVALNRESEQPSDRQNGDDAVGFSDNLGFESDEISKAALINQWLDDCIDQQQKSKKTLVLSFPSIGEEVEEAEGEEEEEEEEEE
ncbi:uncharacterized protein [Ptychodera flava]|uniref:uncharacterized protein isoform X2 n=1 Tax=Ptychodera flava TaxID=63121 RepID=UPI00396A27CD